MEGTANPEVSITFSPIEVPVHVALLPRQDISKSPQFCYGDIWSTPVRFAMEFQTNHLYDASVWSRFKFSKKKIIDCFDPASYIWSIRTALC